MTVVQVKGDVDVFYVDPTEPVRANRIVNHRIYMDLVKSLRSDGWNGPPVVLLTRDHYDPPSPPLGITGSHRLAAAEQVGIDVPCVDLADMFARRGLNLDELLDFWMPEGIDYSDDAQYRAVARILDQLPIWCVRHYDITLIFCPGHSPGRGHQHQCVLGNEHILEDDGWHECVVCGVVFDGVWP